MLDFEPNASLFFALKRLSYCISRGDAAQVWLRRRRGVRISSGAPLPNKTGHSRRTAAAAGGDEPFEDALAAPNADFVVINFDLVDDRADVGAAERRIAGQDVERIVSTNFMIFSSVIRARGFVSVTARS